jgi:hypothetical protein
MSDNKKSSDYTKMPEEDMGPVIDSANRIAKMEAEAAKAMEKKKKVKKKKYGGKVYNKKHGGKTNPYKGSENPMILGALAKKFPETAMDIEDAIGFGKLYESYMKERGKKSLKKIDEDYSGDRPTKKKMGGGKVYNKKHGGKTITSKMSGQDLVNACYD